MNNMQLELPRIVALPALKEKRFFTATVTATPEEKLALAKRYDILAVNELNADVKIKSLGEGLYRVSAKYTAEIVQACGVTLEPLTQYIEDEDEEVLTSSAASLTPFDEDAPFDPNAPTELIENDQIDYGEIVAQLVALSIDPFPRAEGQSDNNMFAHIEHSNNPFAALETLKANNNKKKKED